ncbi:MAG: AIR synthase family protein [Velocimicrobium sp.]
MEMKIGKIPDMILNRSVFKQKKHRRAEVQAGLGTNMDACALKVAPDELLVLSTNPVIGTSFDHPQKAVHCVLNNIIAKGGEPIGILVTILLPIGSSEENLRMLMQGLERVCEDLGIEIIGGHTEVAVAINQPVLSLTGVGKKKDDYGTQEGLNPSDELVMTQWAGYEGAAILASDKKMELSKRYSIDFLEGTKEAGSTISILDAAKIGRENSVKLMHDVTSGGIFGALWEIASAYKIGFVVDLKKIPIRQETIEVCEFFELNPYLLTSRGCLLLVTEHGNELVSKLSQAGILAAVIGRITQNQDKIIMNDDEMRHLEPPKEEELLKAYESVEKE